MQTANFESKPVVPAETSYKQQIPLTAHPIEELLLKSSKKPVVRVSMRKVNKRWVAYIKNKRFYEHSKISRLSFLVLYDLIKKKADVEIQISETIANTVLKAGKKSTQIRWIRQLLDNGQVSTYPDSQPKQPDVSA